MTQEKLPVKNYNTPMLDYKLSRMSDTEVKALAAKAPEFDNQMTEDEYLAWRATNDLARRERMAKIDQERKAKETAQNAASDEQAKAEKQQFIERVRMSYEGPIADFDAVAEQLYQGHLIAKTRRAMGMSLDMLGGF